MKILFICFILFSIGVNAQKHELQFQYRFGFPTDNLKKVGTHSGNMINQYQYNHVYTLYDQGGILSYKYTIWDKYKIYLDAGFEFSETKYYQPLIDPYGRQLDNIDINYQRVAYHIGFGKQFIFFDSKLILDIGFQFVDRYPVHKSIDYISDYKSNDQDWIKYKYELNAYFGDFYNNDGTIHNNKYIYLNADYNAHLKFRIKDEIFFNLGFSYTRNNFFFYNYKYTIQYYENGSTTPTQTQYFLGADPTLNSKFPIRDHFIYINTGISWKF